jgi:hypothetical protein
MLALFRFPAFGVLGFLQGKLQELDGTLGSKERRIRHVCLVFDELGKNLKSFMQMGRNV